MIQYRYVVYHLEGTGLYAGVRVHPQPHMYRIWQYAANRQLAAQVLIIAVF